MPGSRCCFGPDRKNPIYPCVRRFQKMEVEAEMYSGWVDQRILSVTFPAQMESHCFVNVLLNFY